MNLSWDDFLEVNGQKMSNEEYSNLVESEDPNDEEYYMQIHHMEDLIYNLKEKMTVYKVESADVKNIFQEDAGSLFEVWTQDHVFFSEYDDSDETGQAIYVGFRYPPKDKNEGDLVDPEKFFESNLEPHLCESDDRFKRGMDEVIDDLKKKMDDNVEDPDFDIRAIDQEKPGDLFSLWTKHRVYFTEYDEWGDQVVHVAFRHPDWVVAH